MELPTKSTAYPRIKICVILHIRNEINFLRVLLPYLRQQNIEVIVIDNDSTDGSLELYKDFWQLIIRIKSVPHQGVHDHSAMLQATKEVLGDSDHDWVIHHDADEIMEHRQKGKSLRDAIEEADSAGYNVVNFEEFVFLPVSSRANENTGNTYRENLLRYYLFAPYSNRLNRAWKRTANLQNHTTGGHQVVGEGIKVFPENQILRHYIALSHEHAVKKYVGRRYAEQDLALGWHRNRQNITKADLVIPGNHPNIKTLPNFESKDFDRTSPCKSHYWQWRNETYGVTSLKRVVQKKCL